MNNKEWWQIQDVNPTLILMNEIGWQGGTIHQVCQALNCEIEDILYNGSEKFDEIFERARNLQ